MKPPAPFGSGCDLRFLRLSPAPGSMLSVGLFGVCSPSAPPTYCLFLSLIDNKSSKKCFGLIDIIRMKGRDSL